MSTINPQIQEALKIPSKRTLSDIQKLLTRGKEKKILKTPGEKNALHIEEKK